MNNKEGFTIIELIIVIAIVSIIASAFGGVFINNRGATERRAFKGANSFLQRNGITPKRLTCAGDSDHDGYGTCNITTLEGERIILNCPTNYTDVYWFGASECKEVFQNYNMTLDAK